MIHNLTLEGHKEDLKKYFSDARHRIIDGTMFIDMSSAMKKAGLLFWDKKLPTDLMKSDMEKLDFVTWDRYVVDEGGKRVRIYGWIKRKDTHEDFALLDYYFKGYSEKGNSLWDTDFITSSKDYSEKINKDLGFEEEESKCQRVENILDITNMVRLTSELSLTPRQNPSDFSEG